VSGQESLSPQVSVIIPAYNAARFISATLDSVISQTFTDWQVLLVLDNKSSDATKDIVRRYAERDSRIQLIQSPLAQGVTANRNIGLDLAQGEYIAFLDADDQWLPEKLQKQIALMHQNNCPFSYTGQENIAMDSGERLAIFPGTSKTSYSDLLANNRMACSSVMVRREFLGKLRFEDNLAEDMVLWLKLLKRIPHACGVVEPLLRYRVVAGSRSANKIELAKNRWFIYREIERLGVFSSLWYFVQYAVTGYLKVRASRKG
jgi:glycosyltransferase involved in cell wall biosynthesis